MSVLKKFRDGLVFGAGFAVAFLVVLGISMVFVIPRLMDSVTTQTRVPKFEKPTDAEIAKPDPSAAKSAHDFTFFKRSDRMKIPHGGGILAMATTITQAVANRPSTYQLWLTESSLWQIQTSGDKAQVEQLPRPASASVEDLDRLMREKLGPAALQSTMTVSDMEIQKLRTVGSSSRDESLNGKLNITVEGVVFVLPNAYGT